MPPKRLQQRLEAFERHLADHAEQQALAVGAERPIRGEVLRQRPLDRRQQFLHDAVRHGDGVAEANGLDEIVERHDDVDPGLRRRERHFEHGDDAGRAVGAADLLRRVAAQLDDARLLFERDDPRRQDVARLAHPAEGDAAGAAAAARDETADLGRPLGRGVHAQLEAVRPRRRIDVGQLGAGLDADPAGLLPLDLVHRRHVEHDAAFHLRRVRGSFSCSTCTRDAGRRCLPGPRHVVLPHGEARPAHLGDRPSGGRDRCIVTTDAAEIFMVIMLYRSALVVAARPRRSRGYPWWRRPDWSPAG